MTVVAVFGVKQSPGATTLAVALAALAAADAPSLLIEADPAGGDLAARAGRPLDPGLLTLTAAGRRGLSSELLDAHAQTLANGTQVLVAPSSPEHAHAAVSGLARSMGVVIRDRAGLTIVDIGRWDSRSAATDLLRSADAVLALFRPTIEGVEHLRTRASVLQGDPPVLAVMVGERPYSASEVRAALDIPYVHVIADDARGAAAVGSGAPLDRWLRRSAFLRSVTPLHAHISSIDSHQIAAS